MADPYADEMKPDHEKYQDVLNVLVPHIAKICDSQGGVASLSLMSCDDTVKQLLAKVPPQFDTKLTKILGRYGDFFALLEGGNMATYKGYENGRVDMNNRIVKNPPKHVPKEKIIRDDNPKPLEVGLKNDTVMSAADAAHAVATAKIGERPPQVPSMGGQDNTTIEEALANANTTNAEGEEQSLTDVVDEFYQCAFQEDSVNLMRAFQKVRKLRNGTFNIEDHEEFRNVLGVPVNANPFAAYNPMTQTVFGTKRGRDGLMGQILQPKELRNQGRIDNWLPVDNLTAKDRRVRMELTLREMIRFLHNQSNRQSTVVTLTQHPKILGLKKGVVTKFSTFMDGHGDKFLRYANPEGATKSEIVELIMGDQDIKEYMEKTQDAHDDYLRRFPEVMTAEPIVSQTKKQKQAANQAKWGRQQMNPEAWVAQKQQKKAHMRNQELQRQIQAQAMGKQARLAEQAAMKGQEGVLPTAVAPPHLMGKGMMSGPWGGLNYGLCPELSVSP